MTARSKVTRVTAKDPRTQTATKASAAPASAPKAAHAPDTGTQPAQAPLGTPVATDAPKGKKEDLVSVTVHTAFNLTPDDGSERIRYETGVQDIPRSHADHWYSAPHLDKNED
jgi:hypothetical protein